MSEKEYQEFIKRYDRFKNNNLPTCFWDEQRQTREYVWFNNDVLEIENDLTYALGEIAASGLYYPFVDNHFEGTSDNLKPVIGHNHAHSFQEVINALYNSPESFKIEQEDEKYYSKQELQYINNIQKYFLFIGLEDYNNTINDNRFQNKNHAKYTNCRRITLNQKYIDEIKNNELDFIALKYKDYNFKPYEALILNENNDYCLHILIKDSSKIKYKDAKDKFTLEGCSDYSDIELNHIEILEIFN